MHRRKVRLFAAVAAVGAALALGVPTAIAAVNSPKAATVFHACLKDGTLSSVATKSVTCASGFKAVSWDKTGPTGPMGPSNSFYSADSTAQHVASTLSPILSLSLGVGTYVVNADVWLDDESPSNASDLAVCELTLGSATDEVEIGLLGPSGTPQNEGSLSMTVAATIASAGSATVACEGAGGTGLTYADTVNMTAIQSSSLS